MSSHLFETLTSEEIRHFTKVNELNKQREEISINSARWLFYHFISNAGSWNNCYIFLLSNSVLFTLLTALYILSCVCFVLQTKLNAHPNQVSVYLNSCGIIAKLPFHGQFFFPQYESQGSPTLERLHINKKPHHVCGMKNKYV